ncbi:MAG: rhodanese-like domain-containing protein [Longimicrobiales bacterium]|nr:rhodanese-like domain-containing protein [Longimicrobiales bacterium]
MRYTKNRFYILLLLALAGLAGCDEGTTTDPIAANEAELLVDYVESNRGYDVHGGYIVAASDVRTAIVTAPDDYLVVDIRAAADFAAGHIPGAVNVALGALPDYLAGLSPAASTYEKVFLICYSGQSAAYSTGVLRAMGFENVFSMKFGMSAWHTDFSGSWNNNVSNERVTQFVTGASPAMNAAGELPTLDTGFEDGASILEARTTAVFEAGFGPAKVTDDDVFMNTDDYYVINFWPPSLYESLGHIPGAINYDPSTKPFELGTYLTTLPRDKPVVIYCYTGQTSAYITAYLRVLGYDARTLLFGGNSMIHDAMAAEGVTAWDASQHVMDYDYEVTT